MTFADLIDRSGLSQHAFARQCNIAPSYAGQMRKGQRPPSAASLTRVYLAGLATQAEVEAVGECPLVALVAGGALSKEQALDLLG